MKFKNLDLSSDVIDTLILGGGGTKGIVYLGLIRYLEEHKHIETINKYFGVSAGSLICLLINLGYLYEELIDILVKEIDYEKIINITSKSILNLLDKFSIADSSYLEEIIKSLIERKGFNPYINFKQLYNITNKELNIGFTKCFQNEFVLANHNTRPDMPVWLAVRASASIPLVFQPVIDAINGFDFLIDGAILNDNIIGLYLESRYINAMKDNKLLPLIETNNIGIQVPDLENNNNNENNNNENNNNENNNNENNNNENNNNENNNNEKQMKYGQNFICISLTNIENKNIIKTLMELNKINIQEYLISLFRKIFINQAINDNKYKTFIFNINCKEYNIGFTNVKLDNNKLSYILEDSYKKIENYFNEDIININ
jgi:hypothetical protein